MADKVIGAYWRGGRDGAYRNNIAQGGCVDYANIPQEAVNLVSRVASALNIDHAGFDVAVVADHYYLPVFNTLFGNDGLRRRNISVGKYIWEYLHNNVPQPTIPPNLRLSA